MTSCRGVYCPGCGERGCTPTKPITEPSAREWLDNPDKYDHEFSDARYAAGVIYDAYCKSREDGAKELCELLEAFANHNANYKLQIIAAEVGEELFKKLELNPELYTVGEIESIIQSTIERNAGK